MKFHDLFNDRKEGLPTFTKGFSKKKKTPKFATF
jgi:hypothetical protein